jgi:hypothetical protein
MHLLYLVPQAKYLPTELSAWEKEEKRKAASELAAREAELQLQAQIKTEEQVRRLTCTGCPWVTCTIAFAGQFLSWSRHGHASCQVRILCLEAALLLLPQRLLQEEEKARLEAQTKLAQIQADIASTDQDCNRELQQIENEKRHRSEKLVQKASQLQEGSASIPTVSLIRRPVQRHLQYSNYWHLRGTEEWMLTMTVDARALARN